MPISTLISLIPETDVKLRPTMGHHAHAAFLSIMRETNPEVAENLHATSTQKPFTVSPLIADGKRRGDYLHIRAGTECKLRFTFLDDKLFTFFGQSFLTQVLPTIRLGDAIFQVKQLISHATDEQSWSGNATYTELVQSAKTETQMSFRFYSPTALKLLDENMLRVTNCLADFAFYCGTGYKTTMGMGQTRRVD